MGLHKLSPAPGSRKSPKRLGRGQGSGLGKTSGKGHKGNKARKSPGGKLGFEGGQMPLYRRLPKRGFRNTRFETNYDVVNLSDLHGFPADSVVDLQVLVASGRLNADRSSEGLKVLSVGDLDVALTVRARKFSKAAVEKIEKAGGKAEVI